MRSAIAAVLVLVLGSSTALANRPSCCQVWVDSPFDGATNVAPEVEIRYSSSACGALLPSLEGPAGKVLSLDVTVDPEDSRFLLARPGEVLTVGTWKVMTGATSCGRTIDPVSSFEVGGAPKLVRIDFYTGNGEGADSLDVMTLQLSEPTAESALSYVETDLPSTDASGDVDGYISWSYKHLPVAERPKASVPWHVRIRKELPFVSGARMEEDVDVTVTPMPPKQGCSAASGSALPGLLALSAFLNRKRQAVKSRPAPAGR